MSINTSLLRVNILGHSYAFSSDLLAQYPETRLGKLALSMQKTDSHCCQEASTSSQTSSRVPKKYTPNGNVPHLIDDKNDKTKETISNDRNTNTRHRFTTRNISVPTSPTTDVISPSITRYPSEKQIVPASAELSSKQYTKSTLNKPVVTINSIPTLNFTDITVKPELHAPSQAENDNNYGYDLYLPDTDEYFFNRCPEVFKSVARYYLCGQHHLSTTALPIIEDSADTGFVKKELLFWGILTDNYEISINSDSCKKIPTLVQSENFETSEKNQLNIISDNFDRMQKRKSVIEEIYEAANKCDKLNYTKTQDKVTGYKSDPIEPLISDGCTNSYNDKPGGKGFRDKFDHLRESIQPVLQVMTIVVIIVNVGMIVLDSMEEYHWSSNKNMVVENTTTTIFDDASDTPCGDKPKLPSSKLTPVVRTLLVALDWICTIWFTLEFLCRVWAAENRCAFLRNVQTLVDALAILPTYIEFIVQLTGTQKSLKGLAMLKIIRVFRVFRIFRILKLARYESSFYLLGECIRDSWPELSLMAVYLLISTLLFGSLIYYSEMEEISTPYTSIPAAIWWSVVTHFGFADAPPKSFWGRLVAAVAAVWGIVFMAFPIGILVERFTQFFSTHKFRREPGDQPSSSGAKICADGETQTEDPFYESQSSANSVGTSQEYNNTFHHTLSQNEDIAVSVL